QIREVVDKNTVTDEKMLMLAWKTLVLIMWVGIISIFLAGLMATRLQRSIVLPLHFLSNQLV
ncbi:hypothetical protein TI04_13875, partial [Achromatium sp. WMS2]